MVKQGKKLISIDSRIPNHLMKEALTIKGLSEFKKYDLVKNEFKFGKSRLDFLLKADGRPLILEVKSVTLVEDGCGYFPDAVTLRGKRHVEELMKATKKGYEAAVAFVIQRQDAHEFKPNLRQDPSFCEALKKAKERGIKILAYSCDVKPGEISIGKSVPVNLSWNSDGVV